MSQADPNTRHGALPALEVAVEGVSEYMGHHVEAAVWPIIDSGSTNIQRRLELPVVPPAKPATPISYAWSLTCAGNRFKMADQAVVVPSTFGSSVEKLGMQFGSISLGDNISESKA